MDSKIVLLVLLVIAASGCAEQQQDGSGLVVEDFSVVDNTLNPEQETRIETTIVNYNEAPTNLKSEDVEIYNTGQLTVGEKSCTPDEIGESRRGLNPTMACSWTLEAPGEEFVRGFESKPISFNLGLNYDSTLENTESVKIMFQDMDEIEESSEITRTFSNGDLTAEISTQSPVAIQNPQSLIMEISNSGQGSVDGSYSLDFDPDILSDCPSEADPIQEDAQVNCVLDERSTGAINLFASISYKYERSLSKTVEVVNN